MPSHILVDFDRSLALYESGDFYKYGPLVLGEPIPKAVAYVKALIEEGKEVKIFTARDPISWNLIADWTEKHLGKRLEVTNIKTHEAELILDDRARSFIPNTGIVIDPEYALKAINYYEYALELEETGYRGPIFTPDEFEAYESGEEI